MATTGMSQKEYLKKYLSSGSDDKKAKKKKKQKVKTAAVNRMKIVDDDIDISTMRSLDDTELELYDLQEDAPQIAGIIDERPEEVKNKEKFAAKKWRVVADENDAGVKIIDKSISNVSSSEKKLMVDDFNDLSHEMSLRNIKDSPEKNSSNHYAVSAPYVKKEKSSDSDESPPRKHQKGSEYIPSAKEKIIDSDESPPRKFRKNNSEYSKKKYDSDNSPQGKSKRNDIENRHAHKSKYKHDEISSPLWKSKGNDFENANKSSHKDDSDASPPRKSKNHDLKESIKYRHKNDSDESPPRKNKRSPKQNTFSGKQKYDSDESPPRKSKRDNSDSSRRKVQNYDSDESPPRRERQKDVGSFSRRENLYRSGNRWKDSSPPGQRRRGSPIKNRDRKESSKVSSQKSDSDESPPRKNRRRSSTPPYRGKKRESVSPQYKHYKRKTSSSPLQKNRKLVERGENSNETSKRSDYNSRFSDRDSSKYKSLSSRSKDSSSFQKDSGHNDKKNEWKSSSTGKSQGSDKSPEQSREISKNDKRKQTMDGRKAGLVEAGELKAEIADLRQKEKLVFQNMDPSVSGKGVAPVMRDRKTGKKRDLEEEAKIQNEKDVKQAERDAKYMQWGKGLKQVSEQEQKLKEALYEMSKPLARYADDEDLDKFLREQEREGDPMLAYIKSKNKVEDGKVKPQYEGTYMPNRYGIRPGHRWDGVDRSNGYEKQWFEAQNSRKAVEEEAYKWSTSDM